MFVIVNWCDSVSMIEKTIVYFSSPGEDNTETVLALARRRAEEELGIRDIVVASVRGETGVKASKIFKEFNCCDSSYWL